MLFGVAQFLEPMEKKVDSNVVIFCTYAILYANDLSCNLIKDLGRYINGMDKETKKIYGALMKRIRNYDRTLEKIMGDAYPFFADYNANMDEINDSYLSAFRESIVKFYEKLNFENSEFLGYMEAAHVSLTFAKSVRKVVLDVASKQKVNVGCLYTYELSELHKIMDNLSYWCYRHVRKQVQEDLNLFEDYDIISNFTKMNENLLNYDVFEKCYVKTIKDREEENGLQRTECIALTSSDNA